MNKSTDPFIEWAARQEDVSILVPHQHEISFDAYLIDSDYLAEPNRYGEYIATFQPLEMGAMHMIHERGEQALTEVMRGMSSASMKEPRPAYETRDGLIITSQLWAPKLNVSTTDYSSSFFQQSAQVSVKANFHDSKDGKVYLNAQYVDFYERTPQPLEVDETDPDRVTYIDF